MNNWQSIKLVPPVPSKVIRSGLNALGHLFDTAPISDGQRAHWLTWSKDVRAMLTREEDATPATAPAVPIGYMNAGHLHEMQSGSVPYAYLYPEPDVGVSVPVYTGTVPSQSFDEVWDSIDWNEWRMRSIRDLVQMIHSKTTAVPAEIDVRTILLDIAPGDGNGYEVYAKNVDDVVAKLTEMGVRLEDAEAHTPAVPAVPQGWVEQMLTDARHVFDARGPETPQETRDVIEYVASWIAAYRDNLAATPAPAPAQEVATLSLAAEDVHAAFTKNFPKSRISQAWINFAADIAQAIAARAAKPAQEVGLTEAERVRCLIASGCIGTVKMTYDSGPYEITRTSINASRLIDAIIAALRAKGASDA